MVKIKKNIDVEFDMIDKESMDRGWKHGFGFGLFVGISISLLVTLIAVTMLV